MLLPGHIVLYKIEDVLQITDLCDKYRLEATRLIDKIKSYEGRGLYSHDKYHEALKKSNDLMIELQSKSDFIHYNDF